MVQKSKSLIAGRYWGKKKKWKSKKERDFAGKENQDDIPGHTYFPHFSLELEVMKEWGAELLNISTLSSGG